MARQMTALGVAALLLLSVGCTSCPHRAAYDALACETNPGPCGNQRNSVVAVLVGPEATFDVGRVGKLAEGIREAGYSRIYRTGLFHGAWLKSELMRESEADPDLRVVIVGYDLGSRTARDLANHLSFAGVPVDSLVLLDPVAVDQTEELPDTCKTTVVRSHGKTGGVYPYANDLTVNGVGHFNLASHTLALGTVVDELSRSAARIPMEGTLSESVRPSHLGSDWDFLLGPSVTPMPAAPGQKAVPERTARHGSE